MRVLVRGALATALMIATMGPALANKPSMGGDYGHNNPGCGQPSHNQPPPPPPKCGNPVINITIVVIVIIKINVGKGIGISFG